MPSQSVEKATIEIVNLIADGEYKAAVARCASSRLTATDIGRVIQDYGRTFIRMPDAYADYLDIIEVNNHSVPTWSIRAPLWNFETGRSDLTLEITVADQVSCPRVELDDFKVM